MSSKEIEVQGLDSKEDRKKITIQTQTVTNVTRSFGMDPEAMDDLKQSCRHLIKSDTELKQDFQTLLLEDDEFMIKYFRSYIKKDIEFIRQVLNETNKAEEDQQIIIRSVNKDTARKEIEEYIKKHPGCFPSDIMEDLQIDYDLIVEIIKEFKEDKLLSNKPI